MGHSLFMKLHLESFSGAICESIGSRMKLAKGLGRNVQAANFSKELFINFNAAPLHILEKKFLPSIVADLVKKFSFFRKVGKQKPSRVKLLVGGEEGVSASIFNHRRKKEKGCKLPLEAFE